jgi:hypothetical protein
MDPSQSVGETNQVTLTVSPLIIEHSHCFFRGRFHLKKTPGDQPRIKPVFLSIFFKMGIERAYFVFIVQHLSALTDSKK